MDGVGFETTKRPRAMPEIAPLSLNVQSFREMPPHFAPEGTASAVCKSARRARLFVFGMSVIMVAAFVAAQVWGLSPWGITLPENFHLVLSGIAFFWISISFCSAILGFWRTSEETPAQSVAVARPMSVALLVPIYNEDPTAVLGNAAAMLAALRDRQTAGDFSLFILSDTRDEQIAEREWQAFARLQMEQGDRFGVFYRRRAANTDRKTGNIAEWVENWGARYEAMIVLDADSLMGVEAVLTLRDTLALDPALGLVQTWPKIIRADALFARIQQFATAANGLLLSRGLAVWSGNSANYWGHNAIIRTRAFATAAILPQLKSWSGRESLIMSHDFVEAALLRRAGWRVRFLANVRDSFEETPSSLIDYIQRDRRWCRGNMQHLRLLAVKGLHPISRLHLLQGAMSYLLAPIWLALMAIWAFPEMVTFPSLGGNATPPIQEPIDGFVQGSGWLLFAVMATLMGPKLISSFRILFAPSERSAFGGAGRFALAALAEVFLSILYAPILMVQQVMSIGSSILFARDIWMPQRRDTGRVGLIDLMRFHAVETLLGLSALIGMGYGEVTLWLLPISISLALAIPLSALSAMPISRLRWSALRLATPEDLSPSEIIVSAAKARLRYAEKIEATRAYDIAAE